MHMALCQVGQFWVFSAASTDINGNSGYEYYEQAEQLWTVPVMPLMEKDIEMTGVSRKWRLNPNKPLEK